MLCGRLVTAGADGASPWRDQVLEQSDAGDRRPECEALLASILQSTWHQLAERQSEFELLLPDDSEDTALRAAALAGWCEGFLHGLVAEKHDEALKARLAADPLGDMIKDLLEITRAAVDDGDDEEDNELAYAEIVEYVRVAVQLAFEELADLRPASSGPPSAADAEPTLH